MKWRYSKPAAQRRAASLSLSLSLSVHKRLLQLVDLRLARSFLDVCTDFACVCKHNNCNVSIWSLKPLRITVFQLGLKKIGMYHTNSIVRALDMKIITLQRCKTRKIYQFFGQVFCTALGIRNTLKDINCHCTHTYLFGKFQSL